MEYTFAGWFFTSYDGEYGAGLNWSRSNSVTTQNLFASEQVENHRIYAYWIEADYSKATIGYRTTSTTAQSVYVNSTVPDDLFSAYGFVVSTAANATEEEMFIGNTIDGKQVGSYEKGYVYESFKASPIYNTALLRDDGWHRCLWHHGSGYLRTQPDLQSAGDGQLNSKQYGEGGFYPPSSVCRGFNPALHFQLEAIASGCCTCVLSSS